MNLPGLSVIPAGAGSGKTYTIQKRLADWIVNGDVRPDRVLAVTFAEAAASELRERIRGELLARDLPDAALALEQSTITTLHGFGLRILIDYCFEIGVSPAPRLLSDDEQDSLIRHALSETDRADEVMGDLAGFGYRYRYLKGTAEEQFRRRVLDLIGVLRVLGCDEESEELMQEAGDCMRSRYGEIENALPLEEALQKAAEQLLEAFPDDHSPMVSNNQKAVKDFRLNYRDLQRARDGGDLAWNWALWQRLRRLRISCRGMDFPDAYEVHAQRVIHAAAGILEHPGPLDQALIHLGSLFGAAHDSLARHAQAKLDAGLLDYTDMLAMAARAMRRDKAVLEDLASRVDCVVIDEFQDTNPLQFSLLWALHRAGVPALVVGDRKQAIMRFQHADARLLEALERRYESACEPLEENWRTRADLLELMNDIGAGLFGGTYQRLRPRAAFPTSMPFLEVIDLEARGRSNVAPYSVALRIHTLLNDPTQECFDRRTSSSRRLRGEDVAVLCPTHSLLEKYAAALRGLGLRVRVQEQGWYASRIVQLACHGLAYVAGSSRRHSKLYLAVTELGSHTLESALKCWVDGEAIEDRLFEKLDRVGSQEKDRTAAAVLDSLISALDLYGVCARWPDGRQARANLLRLCAEARTFVETHPESLASGAFYGGSLEVFLTWVAARAERDDGQPAAQVVDEQAIYLSTWHQAKGREWPVVAVCGSYRDVVPRLPDIGVRYRNFRDFDEILQEARIEYSPDFVVPEIAERFHSPLRKIVEDDARRLLYVVLTRAREKVILEWPSYLAGKKKVTYWRILQRAASMKLEDGALHLGDREYAVTITKGGREKPKEYDHLACAEAGPNPAVSRQCIQPGTLPEGLTPESMTPSSLAGLELEDLPAMLTKAVAPALDLDLEVQGVHRGSLLHRCLEILNGDMARVQLLPEATGYSFTEEETKAISATVEGFEAWVQDRFAPLVVEREVPVLGLDARRSVISGAIDVLIETTDGYWIIDYKSDRVDDPDTKFRHYLPQLMAYSETLGSEEEGKPSLGVGVLWLTTGEVTLAAFDGTCAE